MLLRSTHSNWLGALRTCAGRNAIDCHATGMASRGRDPTSQFKSKFDVQCASLCAWMDGLPAATDIRPDEPMAPRSSDASAAITPTLPNSEHADCGWFVEVQHASSGGKMGRSGAWSRPCASIIRAFAANPLTENPRSWQPRLPFSTGETNVFPGLRDSRPSENGVSPSLKRPKSRLLTNETTLEPRTWQ